VELGCVFSDGGGPEWQGCVVSICIRSQFRHSLAQNIIHFSSLLIHKSLVTCSFVQVVVFHTIRSSSKSNLKCGIMEGSAWAYFCHRNGLKHVDNKHPFVQFLKESAIWPPQI